MKLDEYIKIERNEFRGDITRLAKYLGVPSANVCVWVSGKRPVPIRHCPGIEFMTGGLVTCEELRPEVPWWVLRSKHTRKKTK